MPFCAFPSHKVVSVLTFNLYLHAVARHIYFQTTFFSQNPNGSLVRGHLLKQHSECFITRACIVVDFKDTVTELFLIKSDLILTLQEETSS
jgi:hypothetical protein